MYTFTQKNENWIWPTSNSFCLIASHISWNSSHDGIAQWFNFPLNNHISCSFSSRQGYHITLLILKGLELNPGVPHLTYPSCEAACVVVGTSHLKNPLDGSQLLKILPPPDKVIKSIEGKKNKVIKCQLHSMMNTSWVCDHYSIQFTKNKLRWINLTILMTFAY